MDYSSSSVSYHDICASIHLSKMPSEDSLLFLCDGLCHYLICNGLGYLSRPFSSPEGRSFIITVEEVSMSLVDPPMTCRRER